MPEATTDLTSPTANTLNNTSSAESPERVDEGLLIDEAHFEALFGHGLNGILLATDRGMVLRANDEARRLFQRDDVGIRGLGWRDIVASEDPRVEIARLKCFDSG